MLQPDGTPADHPCQDFLRLHCLWWYLLEWVSTLGRVPGVLHRHTQYIHIDQDPNKDRYPLANMGDRSCGRYRAAEYGAWTWRNTVQDAIVWTPKEPGRTWTNNVLGIPGLYSLGCAIYRVLLSGGFCSSALSTLFCLSGHSVYRVLCSYFCWWQVFFLFVVPVLRHELIWHTRQ